MDRKAFGMIVGAGEGNRTLMGLRPEDFESSASTSFTTPAGSMVGFYRIDQKKSQWN